MNSIRNTGSTIAAAALALFATIALASPARAAGCEDIANELKNQIDGLKVGITAARVIYLSRLQQ
jgi:type IV secretory pathway VirB2 component (pilin)